MNRMPRLLRISALAFILVFCHYCEASDLAHIERSIGNEPVYKTSPKYCLLLFGAAQTKVWLVIDSDTLYVDRNSNGDLTEEGERIAPDEMESSEEDGMFSFHAGDIRVGEMVHRRLFLRILKPDYLAGSLELGQELLQQNPQSHSYMMGIEMQLPGWTGSAVDGRVDHVAGPVDAQGLLNFADSAADAPVIHFGGPWQITFAYPHRLRIDREADIMLGFGTPGLGAGTTAFVSYEGIVPEDVFPTVHVTYRSANPSDPPILELYELKERC